MMRKAFIFTPAALALLASVWWAAKGMALWDVGAFLLYTVIISMTVYRLSFITSTLAFMIFASMTLTGEIYYLVRQFYSGNIGQEALIGLLVAIIVALMAERN